MESEYNPADRIMKVAAEINAIAKTLNEILEVCCEYLSAK